MYFQFHSNNKKNKTKPGSIFFFKTGIVFGKFSRRSVYSALMLSCSCFSVWRWFAVAVGSWPVFLSWRT